MNPRNHKLDSAFIVYDADRVQHPDVRLFDPAYWKQQGGLAGEAVGRGSALFLDTPFGETVLRQYLRGGLPGRFIRDRYLFTGWKRSRPVAEFNMLARLYGEGLPVPRPIAALTRRHGPSYTGSLMTQRIMGVLPVMEKKRRGHVINISSIGVLSNAPRFSAYVSSKAALDAFSRCASSEFSDTGVRFTTINMPLVRTPMIAPTRIYENVPTISPEEAAAMVKQAVIYKPQRIATRLGIFAQVLHAVAPKVSEIIMNSAFRMFPDSAASQGVKDHQAVASQEQVAFASLMRGIHW